MRIWPKIFFYLSVVFVVGSMVLSCGQNSGGEEKTLTEIAVTPSSVVTTIEATTQFSAIGHYSDGSSGSITPTWIAPSGLGSISATGLFTASGIGLGLIRATKDGITGSSSIVVNDKYSPPPSVPTGIASLDVTNTSATITWETVSSAEGYVLSYGTDENATNLGTEETTVPYVNISGLLETTKYYVKVLAFNHKRSMSNFSSIRSFTTKASWNVEIVDNFGYVGGMNSICIDNNGHAHIAYAEYNQSPISIKLKYATNKTGAWSTTAMDASLPGHGYNPSIASDQDGFIHISSSATYEGLYYFTNKTGSWVSAKIPEYVFIHPTIGPVEIYWYSSIGIDPNGYAHICYQNFLARHLNYATNMSGLWVTREVDSASNTGADNNLAIDSDGYVNNVYVSGSQLKIARGKGASWSTASIGGSNVEKPSIFIDGENHNHIAYHDETAGDIKYITNASGSYSTPVTVMDDGGGGNCYTSIVVDSNGYVHIIANDEYGSSKLRYANNKSGSWQVATIEAAGAAALSLDMAIDSHDNLHISYFDDENKILKYIVYYQ